VITPYNTLRHWPRLGVLMHLRLFQRLHPSPSQQTSSIASVNVQFSVQITKSPSLTHKSGPLLGPLLYFRTEINICN
jgi:hypothetical protein